MAKFKTELEIHPEGWTGWVSPDMENYQMSCCDCSLVHDMQFRVTADYDRVEFRARRNSRSTGQLRRHLNANPNEIRYATRGAGIMQDEILAWLNSVETATKTELYAAVSRLSASKLITAEKEKGGF